MNGLSKMIIDLYNGTIQAYSAESSARVNEALRAKFNEMLPERRPNGKYKHRELMEALPKVFAIIEEVLEVTVNEAWRQDPFYREVVDFRNLALGDKNEFIVPDNTWVVANEFSGNTWDTSREKLSGKKKISLDTKWWFVHVYDDFERFLVGAITVEELLNAVADAFLDRINSMVSTVFNDAATNLPAQFNTASPLVTTEVTELIQKVRVASRSSIRIVGTEIAIAQLNELQEVKWSEVMKRQVHNTGRLGRWMGHPLVEVPQAFVPGTFDWAVDNNSLLIVPGNDRFIKFVDEGDTRSLEKTEDDNNDQTLSWQVQRKMGAAAIFGSAFGKYTIV